MRATTHPVGSPLTWPNDIPSETETKRRNKITNTNLVKDSKLTDSK